VVGYRVTSTFFETLGVNPAVGRTFLAGDDLPAQLRDARAVSVVLSDRLWRRRYGTEAGAASLADTGERGQDSSSRKSRCRSFC
jgi:hypothetical protein